MKDPLKSKHYFGMSTTQLGVLAFVAVLNLFLVVVGVVIIWPMIATPDKSSSNLITPIPPVIPTEPTETPTSSEATPILATVRPQRPRAGLPRDIADFAYDVAFVSREYGGQNIIPETLTILGYVDIPITSDFQAQDVSYAVCINYRFSAIRLDGSRVNNVNRAMLVYIQGGVMKHSQYLDREECLK